MGRSARRRWGCDEAVGMAERDRQMLLERALALADARPEDFHGDRSPPRDADPRLLKRIDDTALRTKLIAVGLAEGLQSPKGPQKIASILRVYPAFDAPPVSTNNGRAARGKRRPARNAGQRPSRLPTVVQLERLLLRYRQIEAEVTGQLGVQLDERIAQLKGDIAGVDGEALEAAYRELGVALERKRALAAQIAVETFGRLNDDREFPEREFLRLLAR
ncbi:MAG: hypothetical protein GIX03_06940 [Candidatus Eremiobacteraeota bacterium]|nr:hypothetical protein [Candidatus Eremiobacteraeota bacterium]